MGEASPNGRSAAVIVAAGTSERFGAGLKQVALLIDRPVLAWSVERLGAAVDEVVVVAPPGREDALAAALAGPWSGQVDRIVPGGETRQASVRAGLEALGDDVDVVLVHDAARPCLGADLVGRMLDAARRGGAAVPVVAVRDTLVREHEGRVDAVLDRQGVCAVQTPQAFALDVIRRAHRRAAARGLEASDDGTLVLAMGTPVVAVRGEPDNIKITWPSDLVLAEAILRGNG